MAITTLRYELSRDDYVGFTLAHIESRPSLALMSKAVTALMYLVLVLEALLIWSSAINGHAPTVLETAPGFALAAVWFSRMHLLRAIMVARKTDVLVGPHAITLEDDALVETTPKGDARYPWSTVQRVLTWRGALYVYVSDKVAVVVPKRAFANVADRKALAAEIEQRRAPAA